MYVLGNIWRKATFREEVGDEEGKEGDEGDVRRGEAGGKGEIQGKRVSGEIEELRGRSDAEILVKVRV